LDDPPNAVLAIRIADCRSVRIAGGDSCGEEVVAALGEFLGLRAGEDGTDGVKRILGGSPGSVNEILEEAVPAVLEASRAARTLDGRQPLLRVTGALGPRLRGRAKLWQVTQVVALRAVWSGGVLIHGALAELRGAGVILAGKSGAGKSTACRRLPPPWNALCDDTCLVARDTRDGYQVHPWPSASVLLGADRSAPPDISRSLPVKAVCMLEQAPADGIRPVGPGEAACLLAETAAQALLLLPERMDPDGELRALRLKIFDNLCSLVKNTPVYRLRLTLTGRFWELLEGILEDLKGM
jgi:hypothetical protein